MVQVLCSAWFPLDNVQIFVEPTSLIFSPTPLRVQWFMRVWLAVMWTASCMLQIYGGEGGFKA